MEFSSGSQDDDRKYILTARLDQAAQAFFNELRQRHFPPERNFLDAHITLFHALPSSHLSFAKDLIARDLKEMRVFEVEIGRAYSLGLGVAFPVRSETLIALHENWRMLFGDSLTTQDRSKKRIHITVQNKVPGEIARATLAELIPLALPTAQIVGFDLHLYGGGPWRWECGFDLL